MSKFGKFTDKQNGKQINGLQTDVLKYGNGTKSLSLETIPNGVDPSDFILQKISEGFRNFIVPEGIILNKPLEIKNIRDKGISFKGVSTNDVDSVSANFFLNTGGIGIKSVNNHGFKFENISLSTIGQSNPSTIGFMLTREDKSGGSVGSCHTHSFKNVSVRLHDDMVKNKGRGTIAIYNNTTEVSEFNNIQLIANTPMIVTKSDFLGLQPTNTYKTSLKDIIFGGYVSFLARGGSGLVLDGVLNVSGTLNTSNIGTDNSSLTVGGVEVIGFNSGVNLNVDCELYKVGFLINGRVEKSNLYINALRPKHAVKISQTTETIVDSSYNKGQLLTSELRVVVSWDATETEQYAVYNVSGSQGIADCLSIGSLKIKNESIVANLAVIGEKPTIDTVNGGQSPTYTVISSNKLSINGKEFAFTYNSPTAVHDTLAYGSLVFNYNTDNIGAPLGYSKKSDGTYNSFGQLGYRTIAVTDVATSTPRQKGEVVFDPNNDAYIAYGTGIGQFKRLT